MEFDISVEDVLDVRGRRGGGGEGERREEERKRGRGERERKRKQLGWIISCRYVFLLFYFLLKTTMKKLHVISHKS